MNLKLIGTAQLIHESAGIHADVAARLHESGPHVIAGATSGPADKVSRCAVWGRVADDLAPVVIYADLPTATVEALPAATVPAWSAGPAKSSKAKAESTGPPIQ